MRLIKLAHSIATLIVFFVLTIPSALANYVRVSDDLVIHYVSSGQGTVPIVFVPGWTMSSEVFTRQLKHFAHSRAYRFISYDPRSQGLTTRVNVGNTYQQHGRDLHAFMTKLNLHGVILGGWSNGAYDVLAYLHQYGSSNLKALVLIDGPPQCSGKDDRKDWVWFRYDDADHYRESLTEGILLHRQESEREFADWMVDHPTAAYRRWIMHVMDETSAETDALQNEESAYLNYTTDVEKLNGKLPLLYIVRREESAAASRWAKDHTPSATVVSFGKHMMFWEYAPQFDQALDQFLKTVP